MNPLALGGLIAAAVIVVVALVAVLGWLVISRRPSRGRRAADPRARRAQPPTPVQPVAQVVEPMAQVVEPMAQPVQPMAQPVEPDARVEAESAGVAASPAETVSPRLLPHEPTLASVGVSIGEPQDVPEPDAPKSEPACAGVRGRVRGVDDEPVEGAELTLVDLTGRQAERAVTDRFGGYRVGVQGAGRFVLATSAATYQPQAITLELGEEIFDLDIVLESSGVLTGIVVGLTGEPLPAASVLLVDGHGDLVTSALTGNDGVFGFDDLAVGSYTVAVDAKGHQPAAVPAAVESSGHRHDRIALSGLARLHGEVTSTDAAGIADPAPAAGVLVTVLDSSGIVVAVATTGPHGEYAIEELSAGEYTVVTAGHPPVANQVCIDPGDDVQHDVVLQQPVHHIA